uniref:sulfite oxidase n=2 Tax=Arcella intermedia TaxID=1963864 RepID=A0A6B2L3C7_9EUKA
MKELKEKEDKVLVSFRDGVYDITEFVHAHPGGEEKIRLATGSSIEPFWNMYRHHLTAVTGRLLETFRVGNLIRAEGEVLDLNDPYANDPERHPALIVYIQKPFNAETPVALLGDRFLTSNELFFVRNHLPVPKVDPKNYKLEVSLEGKDPIYFTLEELQTKFPIYEVTATIQCAGNRRREMNQSKEVKGIAWQGGAISNATWTGPKLRDVLLYAGIPESEVDKTIHHIQFEGLDADMEKSYGASIPAQKVLNPSSEVILAFKMNGETLPLDHGYPIRAVVPGTVGARSVKWLHKVIASAQESPSFWQHKDYKGFGPYTDWHNIDYTQVPAIQELPVQSLITSPPPSAKRVVLDADGLLPIHGYAWSGGGRGIVRVDVSLDDGKTWEPATIHPNQQTYGKVWAWTQWEHRFKVPEGVKEVDLVVKAVDSSYNTQPESWGPVWNVRGVLANAWYKIHLKVDEE